MTAKTKTLPANRWTEPRRRVFRMLHAVYPAAFTDLQLEKALSDMPAGTVRGARLSLSLAGLIRQAGLTHEGRRKWQAKK